MIVDLDERQLAMVDFALRDNLRHTQEEIKEHDDCLLGEPCLVTNAEFTCYGPLMQLHEEASILAGTLFQLEHAQSSIVDVNKVKYELGKLLNESGQHDEGTTTSFEIPDELIEDVEAVKDVPSIVPDPEIEIDPKLRQKLHPEGSLAEFYSNKEKEFNPGPAREEVYIAPWPEEDRGVVRTQEDIDHFNEATQLIHPIKDDKSSDEALHSAEERRGFLNRFRGNS